ncbi:MAG: hypothetical protein J7K98_02410 [Candidatus Aenigmarchaeota archaeon]|nr:hypothetical protein [Candidatus Aenigmarchaeota archaeon]
MDDTTFWIGERKVFAGGIGYATPNDDEPELIGVYSIVGDENLYNLQKIVGLELLYWLLISLEKYRTPISKTLYVCVFYRDVYRSKEKDSREVKRLLNEYISRIKKLGYKVVFINKHNGKNGENSIKQRVGNLAKEFIRSNEDYVKEGMVVTNFIKTL